MKKAVIYINQFFAGIGGEEKADYAPEIRQGLVGPGLALKASLKNAEITHTIICGDNYMGSNTDQAIETIDSFLKDLEFDLFFAGPAFQAGRYGVACGTICEHVEKTYGVKTITSMHEENPGVEMFKQETYIFPGGKSAAAMRKDTQKMASLGDKILEGKSDFLADEEGYFRRGIRHQILRQDGVIAADRAVDMLMKKMSGQDFVTELPIPKLDRVPIAAPIKDLSKATIALVSSGGIVPHDNPDKIQSSSATRWGRYSIEGKRELSNTTFKTIHGGYDPSEANSNPNVVVPLDALREYENEGEIGRIHDYFYATVGTGTAEAEAKRMAEEMIPFLREDAVDAIILTST